MATAHVARPRRLGPPEAVMIARPAGGAGEPSGNPLDELIVVHFQLDDSVELKLLALEHTIQRRGLRQRARKAVENDPGLAVRSPEPGRDDLHNDVVGHE